jgi:hypothetical protein
MSRQYSEQVEAILGRSKRVELSVLGGALATAALVGVMPLPLEAHALGLALIGYASLAALRRLRPGVRLRIDSGGAIEVGQASGTVRDGSFVAPWLAVVRWRPVGAWRDRSLLVAPDMLGADEFRRLRVLLRWGG